MLSAFAFVSCLAPPQLAAAFERPTLRGCQCGGTLDRVKPLRTLTLPCRKTNPVGVICGRAVVGWDGEVWGWDLGVEMGNVFGYLVDGWKCASVSVSLLKDQP